MKQGSSLSTTAPQVVRLIEERVRRGLAPQPKPGSELANAIRALQIGEGREPQLATEPTQVHEGSKER